MGRDKKGVEVVMTRELSALGFKGSVLGVDTALAYHDMCTYYYEFRPFLVTPNIPVGAWWAGNPYIVGVRYIRNPQPTKYDGILVTNPIDSILDTMEFNKYSECISQALLYIEDNKAMCEELADEASKRGISDLLDWEWKEAYDYMNY